MKIIGIVQARMGSTRFPKKVMQNLAGKPMIGCLLWRLSQSKKIDQIILATSDNADNQLLTDYVRHEGYDVFIGEENDVLARYYGAAVKYQADVIVRITGDCPLVDPHLVDDVITLFLDNQVDYVSNTNPPSFPDGLDVEVFHFTALKKAYEEARDDFSREHVTPYMRQAAQFKQLNFCADSDYSKERWTVDEPNDLEVIKSIYNYFAPCLDFSWHEVLALRLQQPQLFTMNQHIQRNAGATMGTGQKLWQRAKRVIPGGNMLLSKRAEMFLPEQWPAYYSKAQGCKVWDLDGKEYIDMSIMGIGTNILGYAHPAVDEAVHATIANGNMSTLNCPEEVYLAERLVAMHPWADMVRFARSGGEANAIAVRIARAASGKDKIAFCGYHGWHDWYLAANLGDERNLDGHLLPGLEPQGVPRHLQKTIFPFEYNRFEQLQKIVDEHPDVGVIMMEVSRNEGPEPGYLEKIRKLATEKGIVLIFDECTSGFRQSFGGLHQLYGVQPDIAMFGKALGNGYAITAVVGKRAVMEAAQSSFISSTFWGERVGPTAALKTLDVMEKLQSWEVITQIGCSIKQGWQALADKYALKLSLWGLPALSGFTFTSENALAYKTLITQEMLAKGFLAANSVYASIVHTPDIIESYFAHLEPIFALLAECEQGRDINNLLNGPICHAGFKRLN